MKKVLLTILSSCILCGCSNVTPEEPKQKTIEPQKEVQQKEVQKQVKNETDENKIDLLTLFSSKTKSPDRAWVGTFQLVFNDMKNNILKQEVKFVDITPTEELIGLNNEEFNSSMLNESSYYTSYGETSPEAKEKIKKDIKRKFNETSDILDMGDWERGIGKYYAYAMLKKKFEFLKEFDELEEVSFNNSEEKFDFFGIKPDSNEDLDKNVRVLFYENENEYAVQLLTKNDDIVYLYRTNDDKSFEALYKAMIKKSNNYTGARKFQEIDTLMVPELKVDLMRDYPELCEKEIEGTNPPMIFSTAIETLKFEMDRKGGKIKSEALIMTDLAMVAPDFDKPKPRHFNFDKTFNLFLIDAGKENPYAAFRIENLKKFQE